VHPFTANIAFRVSGALASARQWAEAEAAMRLCVLNMETPNHVWIQLAAIALRLPGYYLSKQEGKLEEAEVVLRHAVEVADRFSADDWHRHELGGTAWFRAELAAILDERGNRDEAEAMWSTARQALLATMNPTATSHHLWLRLNRNSRGINDR
jgi:hypothetical protein